MTICVRDWQRSTRHRTFRLDLGRPYFCKVMPAADARAEVVGWEQVRTLYPVPELIRVFRLGARHAVVYEHVNPHGDRVALGDLLGDGPASSQRHAALDAVRQRFVNAFDRTGRWLPLADCVATIYADRLRPGGRLDQWYADLSQVVLVDGAEPLSLAEATGWTIVVNGTRYRLDLAQLITDLRRTLGRQSSWWSAISHGDVMESNVLWPECWVDFEMSGWNTLAGELANTLSCLALLGNWLLPRYRPGAVAATTRTAPQVSPPVITSVALSRRHRVLEVTYQHRVARIRAEAARLLLDSVVRPYARELHCEDGGLGDLAPFLALRLMGVTSLAGMTAGDALLCVAKVFETQDRAVPLTRYLGLEQQS